MGEPKRPEKKWFRNNLLQIVAVILSLIAAVAAIKSLTIDKHMAAPYFTLTTESDGINVTTVLRNKGGNIHDVNCRQVCYVKVSCQDKLGTKEFFIWVDFNVDEAKYDYKTQEYVIPQPIFNDTFSFVGLYEPLWKFDLEESLYQKWAETNGENYFAREIDIDFEHCFLIEYKDFRDKDGQTILRLTGNDFDFLNEKDIPRIDSKAAFVLGDSGPDDVCKYIFDKCNIKYSFADGKFTFIR